MPGIMALVKEVGLHPMRCTCGEYFKTKAALRELFQTVLKHCAAGRRIRVENFGTFKARLCKGRKLVSSALPNGSVVFGDSLVLSFTQAGTAKKKLNALAKAPQPQKKKGKAKGK